MTTIGKIYRRGLKGTYQIKFTDAAGKIHRESAGTDDKDDAQAVLKVRIGEVQMGTYSAGRHRVMFADLRKLIESDYAINGKKVDNIKFVLDHLGASFGGSRAVDITATRIADYVTMRKGETVTRLKQVGKEIVRVQKSVANASINRELLALGRMFSLAQKGGMLNFAPNVPHLVENNTREGFLAPAEEATLVSYLPDYLKDPIHFLYLSGWRVGEMKTLEWRDVDEKAGMIVLRRAQSKNGRARTLPLEGEIGELIRRQLRTFEDAKCSNSFEASHSNVIPWVFSHNGKPIGDFRKQWDAARTAAGLGNLLVHDLRRSAVRNLIRAGVSQTVAMKMTGHVTGSVFMRYDVTSEADLRDASKRMQEWVAEQREDKKIVKIGGTK